MKLNLFLVKNSLSSPRLLTAPILRKEGPPPIKICNLSVENMVLIHFYLQFPINYNKLYMFSLYANVIRQ